MTSTGSSPLTSSSGLSGSGSGNGNGNGNGNGSGSGSPSAGGEIDPCNVFVKYLPPDFDDNSLFALFNSFGEIISHKVMLDENGASLGYGFVRYVTTAEAQRAISAMNGQRLGNKTLLCKLSNVPNHTPKSKPGNNLYIKPLLPSTTDEELRNLFSPFGKILDCKVLKDKVSGQSRQIGFVRYSTMQEAAAALKTMSRTKLDPRALPLIIDYAETEEEKLQRQANKQATTLVPQGSPPQGFFPSSPLSHSPLQASYYTYPPPNPFPPYYFEPYMYGYPLVGSPTLSPVHHSPNTMHSPGSHPHMQPVPSSPGLPPHVVPVFPPHAISSGAPVPPLSAATVVPPPHGHPTPIPIHPGASSPLPSPPASPLAPGFHSSVGHTKRGSGHQLHPEGVSLFVFHLPSEVDDAALFQIFAPFGPLESVKVPTNEKGESKGYGFVKYVRAADALQAISSLNGSQFGNKRLKVTFKTQSPNSSAGYLSSSPTNGNFIAAKQLL